jgi:hypothetical protein
MPALAVQFGASRRVNVSHAHGISDIKTVLTRALSYDFWIVWFLYSCPDFSAAF